MRKKVLACVVGAVYNAMGRKDEPISKEVSEAMSFDELGLDSLDTAELALDLEDLLDIEIQEDDFKKLRTVGEATDFITKMVD